MAVPQIPPSIGHIIPTFFPFSFCITLGCGEVGGEAFFKIPALIKADTQPSHECIWRNVPILKTNDDCLALLRKMELPRGPWKPCRDEAESVATHPGENIHLRRAIKVVESKRSGDLGNILEGKSDCPGI